MYDISGNARETVVATVKRDWIRVVDELRLIDSPRYLRHNGRPLLAIWGFDSPIAPPTPAQAAELIDFFMNHPDPRYRVTLLGGVPSRVANADARLSTRCGMGAYIPVLRHH